MQSPSSSTVESSAFSNFRISQSIFIPSFVVVFDVTANKTEFVGSFLANGSFTVFFAIVAYFMSFVGHACLYTSPLRSYLRTGIIVAAGIVVAAVSGVTIYVCNVTTNKGEFLANFIINTGFSVLLMLVSFFMGAFCTLKKDRRTGILVAAGIVVATVSGATIYVYNVTANKGEFLANFIISTGVSVLLMLVSFFMLPQ
ncbi:hypothetical protein QR680_016725 [Steinernema hermaphroditum]|uniref:Uncharacterized protein n=1 Tax=Steinernema hermaphroditum TaxID=289476 RepID=A0AA39HE97_9BILA|nr:hypothetical protein QR680_016725 [Steinernema hermaphroditum]